VNLFNNHLTNFSLPIFIKLYNKNIKRRKNFCPLVSPSKTDNGVGSSSAFCASGGKYWYGLLYKSRSQIAVLTDIFLLFFSTAAGIVLKNF